MNKNLIKLTENDLHKIVKKSVCLIISEMAKHSNINAYNNDKLSDFLENLPYDENWYEDIYGALNGNDNQIRLNLIDNGYCITVCAIIGWQFSESPLKNDIELMLALGYGKAEIVKTYPGQEDVVQQIIDLL